MKEHLKTYTELRQEIEADAARTTALLRYHGFVDLNGFPHDPKDRRSRAQREGRYAGKVNGKHVRDSTPYRWLFSATYDYYTPTRKARKNAWIETRKKYAAK